MRKMNFILLIVAVASLGYLSSCNKDTTTPPPSISFNNVTGDTVFLAPGVNSCILNATLTASGKFASASYTLVSGSTTTTNPISVGSDTTYQFSLTIPNITATTKVTITVTDKNSASVSKSINIKLAPVVLTEVLNFWTGTLAAQLWAQASALGSSYATSTNTVYTKTNAANNQSLVDFIYYYSSTSLAEIISPYYASQPGVYTSYVNGWATNNATKFGATSLTAANFDAIVKTDDSQVVSAASNLSADKVSNLAANNVFAFQTAASKMGLVKVTNVDLGSGDGTDGSITIEVKVQK